MKNQGIIDVKKFSVKHNLDKLSEPELVQYLRDVSEFIGLDPDLNGLDTIWMTSETGPGRSLVVYARRGTAEILRNIYEVNVDSLTYAQVGESFVFTAIGRSKRGNNRQEIAIGSKSTRGLTGKDFDDAVMTASTRALRRLTMQFTTLGLLDESEVVALIGHAPNPAGSVLLAANPTPPVFAQPTVPANNAPGKVETIPDNPMVPSGAVAGVPFHGQQDQIDEAMAQLTAKRSAQTSAPEAAKTTDTLIHIPTASPIESVSSPETGPATEPAAKAARKPRKPRNQVSLEVEPEVVSSKPATSPAVETAPKTETIPAPPPQTAPEPQAQPVASPAGLPSAEQMADYKVKIGVYTSQLPASEGMPPSAKMRAFITTQSGTPPQNMTVVQWEQVLAWFPKFSELNGIKGLVKYINDTLGVK